MRQGLRNLIVVTSIAIIAATLSYMLFQLQFISLRESVAAGLVGFGVLLVLHNNISLQRKFARLDRHMRAVHGFEETVNKRLLDLETANSGNISGNNAAGSAKMPGLLADLPGVRGVNDPGAVADNVESKDNIIALSSHVARADNSTGPTGNSGGKPFKIKPSQLAKLLDNGGSELYLQPIMELPSRNIRYFEAFVRLRVDDNILTAKQFLPAAKDSGQIAKIDLISLGLTVKVVRSLQRQNNEYPVFWNIAPQTLGNKAIFKELLEQLRANQPLNRQLICEISHSAYLKLNTVQSDNLSRIRDLGYELSLDNIDPAKGGGAASVKAIVENGMFGVLKIPAMELTRIAENDISNFADYIVPLAAANNVTVIASDVENDAQGVAMIDADIYLAQGDALMPAKALKKELGGP